MAAVDVSHPHLTSINHVVAAGVAGEDDFDADQESPTAWIETMVTNITDDIDGVNQDDEDRTSIATQTEISKDFDAGRMLNDGDVPAAATEIHSADNEQPQHSPLSTDDTQRREPSETTDKANVQVRTNKTRAQKKTNTKKTAASAPVANVPQQQKRQEQRDGKQQRKARAGATGRPAKSQTAKPKSTQRADTSSSSGTHTGSGGNTR